MLKFKIGAALVVMCVCAGVCLAEGLKVPSDFPDISDFKKSQLDTQEFAFEWKRDPGTGGQNYGKDWEVDKGRVIVGWEIQTISERHTKGNRDLHLNFSGRNDKRLPTGVHNGHRLTPGGIGGVGAAYKGIIKVWTVSERDWYRVANK